MFSSLNVFTSSLSRAFDAKFGRLVQIIRSANPIKASNSRKQSKVKPPGI